MSDIEPVRHEPKKVAGRQQRHVEIELAGFERGIRAAVLHLERTGTSGPPWSCGPTSSCRGEVGKIGGGWGDGGPQPTECGASERLVMRPARGQARVLGGADCAVRPARGPLGRKRAATL